MESSSPENGHNEKRLSPLDRAQDHNEELEDGRGMKRPRLDAAMEALPSSASQTVSRRLWVKSRSQAWWEHCSSPAFSDSEFQQAFRMSRSTFDIVCNEIGAFVAKQNTALRRAIPVRQRVAVCIWRLATGEPLRLVSRRFGLGVSTCHNLILEICAAISEVLLPKYVHWPEDENAHFVMDGFEHLSGIADIIGSMYTTHVPVIAPKENFVAYYNRKLTESSQKAVYTVTLQGVVDASGKFTDLCIGWPGSLSDERVLENSALYQRGISGQLPGVWVLGCASYPLLDWLLIPYKKHNLAWTQHVFNQKAEEILKISRNAFSRLKGRWRFLQKRVEVKLQELPAILGACCVLHNVCELHHENYDDTQPVYEIHDEEVQSECIPWSQQSLRRRDQLAHDLLHNARSNLLPFS